MSTFWLHTLFGMVGSVAPELLAARDRWSKLDRAKMRVMLKSPLFWLLVGAATLAAGLVAGAALDQLGRERSLGTAMLLGAGARSLLQQGAREATRRRVGELGAPTTTADVVRAYFS